MSKTLKVAVLGCGAVWSQVVRLLTEQSDDLAARGIGGVVLFGLPESKDAEGSGAWAAEGIVQRAIRALRRAGSPLVVVADVCLCEYTSHGHCGLVEGDEVLNDVSLELLAKTAVSHAEAGADAVAAGRVAQAMAKRYPDRLDVPVTELHDLQVGWCSTQAESFQQYMRRAKDPTFTAHGDWPHRPLPFA